MKPRERVRMALEHKEPDRVPRFEIWIDQSVATELGYEDLPSAHVGLGLDGVPFPKAYPKGSNIWQNGVDEWGQIWSNGMYAGGLVKTEADLERYTPPVEVVQQCFDTDGITHLMKRFPDHCFFWAMHMGPFTAGFMAMGFEEFFLALVERPGFVHKILQARTEWNVAMYRRAESLGAELLVLGDDAGHKTGPMISPRMWREFILPYHRRIVGAVNVPVIWHSDGAIWSLLPMAVAAGFAGVHALEPSAGIDLGKVKAEFGEDLVLVGNVDMGVLCGSDLEAVRQEVSRCMEQGASGGGYMLASSNSIYKGVRSAALVEMYRYAGEVGVYEDHRWGARGG